MVAGISNDSAQMQSEESLQLSGQLVLLDWWATRSMRDPDSKTKVENEWVRKTLNTDLWALPPQIHGHPKYVHMYQTHTFWFYIKLKVDEAN